MTDLTLAQTAACCAAILLVHLLFYYTWTAHNCPVAAPHDAPLPTLDGGAQ
jgi:hypothetical protein